MRTPRPAVGLAAALTCLAVLVSSLTGGVVRTDLLAEPPVPPITVDAPPPDVGPHVAVDHPSLIVRRGDYRALRSRADRAPWSGMKKEAAARCRLTYSAKLDTYPRGIRMRDIMGGCSLMYVLDPKRAATYKARMATVFNGWPAMLATMKKQYPRSSNRWLQVVPPSSGYFNSVLALDVLHDDLPASTLRSYERSLDAVAEWYWAADRGWGTATYGARAIWATYQGDVSRRTLAATQYRRQYLAWLTADGGYRDGTEYALARNGGERSAKQGFLYVAEFTGVDPHYYDDPQVVGSMEWLMSYAYGPFNQMVGFGDSGALARDLDYFQPETALYAAGRFSAAAGAAAARHLAVGGSTPPGDLLSYAVATAPVTKATNPVSQVWPASGAALWQRNRSSQALMGALWNPRLTPAEVTVHMHREVNALYLSGYGEPLLVNAGYAGYGKGALGASWSTLRSARSSNTVTLAGADHRTAAGDGVDDHLIGSGLDYASGVAGQIYSDSAEHRPQHRAGPPAGPPAGLLPGPRRGQRGPAGHGARSALPPADHPGDHGHRPAGVPLGHRPREAPPDQPVDLPGHRADPGDDAGLGDRRSEEGQHPRPGPRCPLHDRRQRPAAYGHRVVPARRRPRQGGDAADLGTGLDRGAGQSGRGPRLRGRGQHGRSGRRRRGPPRRRCGGLPATRRHHRVLLRPRRGGLRRRRRARLLRRPSGQPARPRPGRDDDRAEPTTVRFSYPGLGTVRIDGRPTAVTRVAGGLRVRVPAGRHALRLES